MTTEGFIVVASLAFGTFMAVRDQIKEWRKRKADPEAYFAKQGNANYKTCVVLAILMVGFGGMAHAKTREYPLTGTITYSSFNFDAEAHTTVDGHRYDAYCNGADCNDHAGVFYLTLADGHKYTFFVKPTAPGNPIVEFTKGGAFQYRQSKDGICLPYKSKESCYIVTRSLSDGVSDNR